MILFQLHIGNTFIIESLNNSHIVFGIKQKLGKSRTPKDLYFIW